MKVRNGFVSNSSSSSFIIGCSEIPKTLGDSMNIWFGDKQRSVSPDIIENLFEDLKEIKATREDTLTFADNLDFGYDERLSDWNKQIAYEIFNDLSFSEMYGGRWDGSWSGVETYKDFCSQYPRNQFPNRWEIDQLFYETPYFKNKLKEKINEFFDKFEGYLMMQAEFGDDGDLGSRIEHGDHWELFPVTVRFSHH